MGVLTSVIGLTELTDCARSFRKGRAPGADGLTVEFYLCFWDLVGPDLLTIYKDFDRLDVMPDCFREGVVTLLQKKGETSDIKNWRPITLLNVDTKFFSKVLTIRMRTVLGGLIHPDQTCAVAGRRITDSLVLVRDAICLARDRRFKLAVLNLDFEKAYDRVSHQYLFAVLKKMGFPAGFLARVGLLYAGAKSTFLVNGFQTRAVTVNCGVRQGCPLSPLLFVCCMEPLAEVLRRESWIAGLKIPGSGGREARCVYYMDDVTVLMTDGPSVAKAIERTEWFGEASGSKLNRGKTVLKLFGQWGEAEKRELPLKESGGEMKVLGVEFDTDGLGDCNWVKILDKVEKKVQFWRLRQLTMAGKVLIVKSMLLPLLLFVGVVFVPSRAVLSRLDRMVFRFLVGSGWERVRREWLKRDQGKGGRGVPDFHRFIMCKFVALHVSMCVSSSTKAACLSRFFMGGYLRRLGILKIPLTVPVAFLMPSFYQSVQTFLMKCGLEREGADTLTSFKSLLSVVQGRDPTCPVRGQVLGQAETIWSAVTHPDLFNRHKDMAWLIAHGVLSVRAVMFSRRLARTAECPRDGCTEAETVRHVLWDCRFAQRFWRLALQLLKPLMKGGVLDWQVVLQGGGKKKMTESDWSVLWRALNSCRWTLWVARTVVLMENKTIFPEQAWIIATEGFAW